MWLAKVELPVIVFVSYAILFVYAPCCWPARSRSDVLPVLDLDTMTRSELLATLNRVQSHDNCQRLGINDSVRRIQLAASQCRTAGMVWEMLEPDSCPAPRIQRCFIRSQTRRLGEIVERKLECAFLCTVQEGIDAQTVTANDGQVYAFHWFSDLQIPAN